MIERKSLDDKNRSARKLHSAPVISFFFTAASLLVLFAVLGLSPFGSQSILVSDLAAQFAPDLVAFKHQLLSGRSLDYSFLIGLGKSTSGFFAYYLSSPFNILILLFPASHISEAVLLIMVLKLSLAGAFMTLYLRSFFKSSAPMSILFGMLYSFSTYAIVFMMIISWMDGLMLLPLVIYFAEKFLHDQKNAWKVILVLFWLFVSNFYIAYMVGIFSFLYLIMRYFGEKKRDADERKKGIIIAFQYVGCALVSAAMTAAVLLPSGIDILANSDSRIYSQSLDSNFSWLTFLNNFFLGSFDELSSNSPLVFCGTAILLLVALFFLNPDFSRRHKTVVGASIIFMLVSFNFPYLDLAWQLFDKPNWFLYRYSFLLIAIFLCTAYASYLHLQSISKRSFAIIGLVFLAALFFVQRFGDLNEEGDRFYLIVLFLLADLLLLYLRTLTHFPRAFRNMGKLIPAILSSVIIVEMVFINPMYVRNDALGGTIDDDTISDTITQLDDLVAEAEDDADQDHVAFYRMESNGQLSTLVFQMNAGLYLDYHAISTFNSCANHSVNRFLKQFGMAANYNYAALDYLYPSVVTDSILGVRYLLSSSKIDTNYEVLDTSENGDYVVASNDSALPILYLVEPDANDFDFYSLETHPEGKDPFAFQNDFLASFFGSDAFEEPVYYEAESSAVTVYNGILREATPAERDSDDSSSTTDSNDTTSDESVEDEDPLGEEPVGVNNQYQTTYLRINSTEEIALTYSIHVTSNDMLYFSVPAVGENDDYDVYVDGEFFCAIDSSHYTEIFSLGKQDVGDDVSIELRADADTLSIMDPCFYYCDADLFEAQLDDADPTAGISDLYVEDGYVTASVSCSKDQLLFTSIPYEAGWTLYVDGTETDIAVFQDAMISVPLSSGNHTIKLVFKTPGQITGCVISGIGFLGFALVCVQSRRRKATVK